MDSLMTIELKPEQAKAIDQAIRAGLVKSADEVVEAGLEALRERRQVEARSENPEEWMRRFRAWAHSHPTTTPVLSDGAISRESIYRERGL
jgi:Arc/MetJ-type ribon-helix-helix transcriptional regulator